MLLIRHGGFFEIYDILLSSMFDSFIYDSFRDYEKYYQLSRQQKGNCCVQC